jgi:hypothetical protein
MTSSFETRLCEALLRMRKKIKHLLILRSGAQHRVSKDEAKTHHLFPTR